MQGLPGIWAGLGRSGPQEAGPRGDFGSPEPVQSLRCRRICTMTVCAEPPAQMDLHRTVCTRLAVQIRLRAPLDFYRNHRYFTKNHKYFSKTPFQHAIQCKSICTLSRVQTNRCKSICTGGSARPVWSRSGSPQKGPQHPSGGAPEASGRLSAGCLGQASHQAGCAGSPPAGALLGYSDYYIYMRIHANISPS